MENPEEWGHTWIDSNYDLFNGKVYDSNWTIKYCYFTGENGDKIAACFNPSMNLKQMLALKEAYERTNLVDKHPHRAIMNVLDEVIAKKRAIDDFMEFKF